MLDSARRARVHGELARPWDDVERAELFRQSAASREHGTPHQEVTSKTIRLAGILGVERVVTMSGCPGGPGDANANWVTTAWPPEARVLA